MTIIFNLFILLVALEFFYIMYLETFATTSNKTAAVFKMSKESLANKNIQTLFKNQGIYNGLLGVGLLYARFIAADGLVMVRFLLIYILLVAAYGAYSSDKSILLKQGGLAFIALLFSFFLY